MNHRKIIGTVMILCLSLFFLITGTLTAADTPDIITFNSKVYESDDYPKHKKRLVTFNHKKHSEYKGSSCQDCHHVYKDGKNIWKKGDEVQKCEACHTSAKKAKGDKTKMKKAERIKKYHYDAIHANCKICHKKMIDKKSPMGKKLKKCSGCHPNKR